MKTERELFEEWFKNKFHDLHEAICCGDLVAKNYKKAMFKAWQARVPEGYVVVPVEPSDYMIDVGMDGFCFPLDNGCFNNHDLIFAYRAMLEAVEK